MVRGGNGPVALRLLDEPQAAKGAASAGRSAAIRLAGGASRAMRNSASMAKASGADGRLPRAVGSAAADGQRRHLSAWGRASRARRAGHGRSRRGSRRLRRGQPAARRPAACANRRAAVWSAIASQGAAGHAGGRLRRQKCLHRGVAARRRWRGCGHGSPVLPSRNGRPRGAPAGRRGGYGGQSLGHPRLAAGAHGDFGEQGGCQHGIEQRYQCVGIGCPGAIERRDERLLAGNKIGFIGGAPVWKAASSGESATGGKAGNSGPESRGSARSPGG